MGGLLGGARGGLRRTGQCSSALFNKTLSMRVGGREGRNYCEECRMSPPLPALLILLLSSLDSISPSFLSSNLAPLFICTPPPSSSRRQVVQAPPDLSDGQLAPPPVPGPREAGRARRLPAVEQRFGPCVPGGPRGACRHPPGLLQGRPQRWGQQCLRRPRWGARTVTLVPKGRSHPPPCSSEVQRGGKSQATSQAVHWCY